MIETKWIDVAVVDEWVVAADPARTRNRQFRTSASIGHYSNG